MAFLAYFGNHWGICKKIIHVDWGEELFSGKIPQESVEFWVGVGTKRVAGSTSYPFKEISEYALACLVTPTSTVVVERVFSQVTTVKNKLAKDWEPNWWLP